MNLPREVRIIGGQWKRSKLPVADSPGLRPTPDRVRETLFNWLGQDLSGWRCLDAFAGSGALGFEAASRGAAEVVLVERDPRIVRSLRESQQRLQATALRVEAADALAVLRRANPQSFELVFIDPPFDAWDRHGREDPPVRMTTQRSRQSACEFTGMRAPAPCTFTCCSGRSRPTPLDLPGYTAAATCSRSAP